VLVLEAGSNSARLGMTARLRGVTLAKYKKQLQRRADVTATGDPSAYIYEALAPGGLSNHWSCAVPRFSREDFADAARAGEAYAWPVSYEELAPWYDRVEPLLNIAGSQRDVPHLPAGRVTTARELGASWRTATDSASQAGRSIVAMPYAYGAATTVTFAGTPFNAFVRLIRPQLSAGRMSIRYGTRALRLEHSAGDGRVHAVHVRSPDGKEERLDCDGVILAAGAINTTQILLESTSSDFPEGLANTHGVLGRYFHDHPLGKLTIDLPDCMEMTPAAYVTRRGLSDSAPLYAAACMQWSGVRALVKSAFYGHPGKLKTVGFSVFGTMAPTPEDRVELDHARPPVAGVRPLLFHSHHPAEAKRVLDEARDDILTILEKSGWRPRLQSWAIEPVGNSVHYGGTVRMHAAPRFGMVDGLSRLHGVRNVAVADASVFTTSPEKNPVLTAMTLAARAADSLAKDLRPGS
jgi:choline dehydrogenase-like flavoprotein